jgi:hemolysin III
VGEIQELAPTAPRVKPRLRGVFHKWCFIAAIPLGAGLGLVADGGRARVAGAVFAGSVVAMFGASALHHCITWTPAQRRWTRRVDHAGIFGLIAGSYTPFGLLTLSGAWRIAVLAVVWTGAFAAIVFKLAWTDAPRWISAVIAVALGWVAVIVFPQLLSHAGLAVSLLVAAGGLCYTAGAVIYALKRPNPAPHVFGYHEVFHVLVVAAVAFQYTAVGLVVA